MKMVCENDLFGVNFFERLFLFQPQVIETLTCLVTVTAAVQVLQRARPGAKTSQQTHVGFGFTLVPSQHSCPATEATKP